MLLKSPLSLSTPPSSSDGQRGHLPTRGRAEQEKIAITGLRERSRVAWGGAWGVALWCIWGVWEGGWSGKAREKSSVAHSRGSLV